MAVTHLPAFIREEVDGVKVVKDEVYASGLSFTGGRGLIPLNGYRTLTLADDTVVIGCRDCPETGTYGQMRIHRRDVHGVSIGRSKKTAGAPAASFEEAEQAGMVAKGFDLPPESLSMTLFELLEYAKAVDEWELVFANQEARAKALAEQWKARVDDLTRQRNEAEMAKRAAEHALKNMRSRLAKLLGVTVAQVEQLKMED